MYAFIHDCPITQCPLGHISKPDNHHERNNSANHCYWDCNSGPDAGICCGGFGWNFRQRGQKTVIMPKRFGGPEGTRTPDPLHAMQVRYQLRHRPENLLSLHTN